MDQSCYACRGDIGPETFAIVVDKRAFHQRCFVCATCGRGLSDGLFYNDQTSGKVHCRACRPTEAKLSVCECGHAIDAETLAVVAGDKRWHPDCFKCAHCKVALADQEYFLVDQKPYCRKDAKGAQHLTCRKCGQTIDDSAFMEIQGEKYHRTCLSCSVCNQPIQNREEYFTKSSGAIVHSRCDTCALCQVALVAGARFVDPLKLLQDGLCRACASNRAKEKGASPLPQRSSAVTVASGSPSTTQQAVSRSIAMGSPSTISSVATTNASSGVTPAAPTLSHSSFHASPSSSSPSKAPSTLTPPPLPRVTASPQVSSTGSARLSPAGSPAVSRKSTQASLHTPCPCGQPRDTPDKHILVSGKEWHLHCFVCVTCGVPLKDQECLEVEGKIYCKRDSLAAMGRVCASCHTPIEEDQCAVVEGRKYHTKCFLCARCKKPFTKGEGYLLRDNQPIHRHCDTCTRCNAALPPDGRYLDKTAATQKFICQTCALQDQAKAFSVSASPSSASTHEHAASTPSTVTASASPSRSLARPTGEASHGPLCSCGRVVTDDAPSLVALGKTWHLTCFRCAKCQEDLSKKEYFEVDGQPYCRRDKLLSLGTVCARCSEVIDEQTYAADSDNRKYHTRCFVCARCSKPFQKGESYLLRDGQPIHRHCDTCIHCHVALPPGGRYQDPTKPVPTMPANAGCVCESCARRLAKSMGAPQPVLSP